MEEPPRKRSFTTFHPVLKNPYDSDSDTTSHFAQVRRGSIASNASSCLSDTGKDDEDNEGKHRPKKSKRRSRATAEQLTVLEEAFETNTSPNSKMRECLAEKVGMSERSIQIWFQNRRAKMNQAAKKANALQEEAFKKPTFAGMYPFLVPNHLSGNGRLPLLAHQERLGQGQAKVTRIAALPGPNVPNCYPSPQPNTNSPPSFSVYPIQPPANNGLRQLTNVKSNAQAPTQHNTTPLRAPTVAPDAATNSTLSCDTLSIGSWRRVCLTPGDFQCFNNPIEKVFQWQVAENGVHFMMEFSYSALYSLEYQTLDANSGQLILDLKHAPTFFMMQIYSQPGIDGSESYVRKWTQCQDFTEGQQASRFFRHTLKGSAQALVKQIQVMKESDEGLNKIWKPETSLPSSMNFGPQNFGKRRSSEPIPDPGLFSDLNPAKSLSPLAAAIAELSAGMNSQFSDQTHFSNPSDSNPSSPFMFGMDGFPSSPANQSGSPAAGNVKYLAHTSELAVFAQNQQQRAIAQAHSAWAKIGRSASVPELQLKRNDVNYDFLAYLGQDITLGPSALASHKFQAPVYACSQEEITSTNDGFYNTGNSLSPLPQSLARIGERDDYSSMLALQQSLTPNMIEAVSLTFDFDQNALFGTSDVSSSYEDFLSQTNTDNMFSDMSSPTLFSS